MHAHVGGEMRKIGIRDDVTVDGLGVAVLLWPEPEQRALQWRAAAELARAGAVVSVAPPSRRNLEPDAAAFSKAVPLAEALVWPLQVEAVETTSDLLPRLPKSVRREMKRHFASIEQMRQSVPAGLAFVAIATPVRSLGAFLRVGDRWPESVMHLGSDQMAAELFAGVIGRFEPAEKMLAIAADLMLAPGVPWRLGGGPGHAVALAFHTGQHVERFFSVRAL
jgi:hypothetical protein